MTKLEWTAVLVLSVGTFRCGLEASDGMEMGVTRQAMVAGADYNVYYGHLHNHSNVSDGSGTPAEAYRYARNTAKLDFFGLADHAGSISSSEWTATKAVADAANADGTFTAFWGFEWSSNRNYGHVTVVNTPDYTTESSSSTDTFAELSSWLSTRDGVAFLNHPGREDTGHEFDHFSGRSYTGGASYIVTSKVVGIELFNKTDDFGDYYYNDGYNAGDGNLSYLDEANRRGQFGWKLGAAGGDDNHKATWGTSTEYRLAILANSLTRASLLEAMRARRFFSTLDKNLALSFQVDGQPMGSTLPPGTYRAVISASDADGEEFTNVELRRGGAVEQRWTISATHPELTFDLNVEAGSNHYVIIRQADGDEAISSPIWGAALMDDTPPTAPALLRVEPPASGQTRGRLTLAWSPSNDAAGVTGYDIYRAKASCTGSFALIATEAGSNYTNKGLRSGSSYCYRLAAKDASGNESQSSNTMSGTAR